jgi:hypothetical protein
MNSNLNFKKFQLGGVSVLNYEEYKKPDVSQNASK